MDRICVRASLIGQNQDYFLLPMNTLEAVEAFVKIISNISDWDKAYALSANSAKLFNRIKKLYNDKTTKEPIKGELKGLLGLLESAQTSHNV